MFLFGIAIAVFAALGWYNNQQVSKVVVGPTGVMQAFIDLLGNSAYLMSGSTLVPGLRPSLPLTSLYDLFGQIKTSVQTVVPAVNNSLNTIGSGVFVRF
jgi:hypothetical protein